MMFPHLWYAPEDMARHVDDLRREAEVYHLGRQLVHACPPARRVRRLLSELGRILVALGHRLEQFDAQPCTPIEGGVGCAA
jgi:hypothetical protein